MDKATEAKVMDNTYFSVGFPSEDWHSLINRENHLSQIEDILTQGAKILFIEGEEDSGKTTLCGQFARRNCDHTITIFFNPLNTLDYNIEFYCSNVVAQIKNILKEEQNEKTDSLYGIEQHQTYIFRLRKVIRRDSQKINIVIDGLEDKINESPDFLKKLFEIIPFGQDIFNIILTGEKVKFTPFLPKKLKLEDIKSINLAGFSEPEIVSYLGTSTSLENERKDLFKITKGFPGRLKTLKRIIQNDGYSVEKISGSTTYLSWLELDCSSIDLKVALNNGILSLLALEGKSFQMVELSKIFNISVEELEKKVGELKVLEKTNQGLIFISSAHKRYFANILMGNRRKIQDLLINFYATDGNINSLLELPKLYSEKQEWGKIISLIDESYIQKILEGSRALRSVNERLELGVKASEKMNRYVDMWRYSVQGSLVNELDNYLFWESEINARVSINDFAGAISLAESAILHVDRLKLLALIARRQKERNKSVDEDLVRLIKEIYILIDLSSVGNKIYDIVADLIYAIPNLAIEMIEKTTGEISEKNINDWIVAKLSIAAIDSSINDNEDSEKDRKLEAINNLNKDSFKKIHRAISFLVENYSSMKVLDEVKKLSDPKERLRLLRLWLNNHRSNIKEVDKVIEVSLEELVKASAETSITYDILKELSYQLPYIKDSVMQSKLYKQFKSIEKGVKNVTLTKNKYTYELNLFHTEYSLDKNKAINTINRIINEVEQIKDILIKLECFAEVYAKLRILRSTEFNQKIKFVHSRVMIYSKNLFDTTANHTKLSENILRTIGKGNPVLSLKICEQINTFERREHGKLVVLASYLENNLKRVDIKILKVIEDSLGIIRNKQALAVSILERYADARSLHFDVIKELQYFVAKIAKIKSPAQRVYAYVLAYKIISKNDEWKKRCSKQFEQHIISSLESIVADWEKIDIGFTICSDISTISEKFAKEIFSKYETLKSTSWIDSQPVAFTYLNSIKLVIRAYRGLLVTGNMEQSDYRIIEDLINRIPSELEKLKIWTEAGFNCYLTNSDQLGKNILNSHILPLAQGLLKKNIDLMPARKAFTYIHLFNPQLALDFIKGLEPDLREIIYSDISYFYITRRSPFDLYDTHGGDFSTTYNDIMKALDVIALMDTDGLLYFQMDYVLKAIQANRQSFSTIQTNAIADKLKDIIDKKLPDSKNITHEGYKILCELKIVRIRKGTNINNNAHWSQVIAQANNIPNLSDKLFVKAILIDEIPFEKIENGSALKASLFDEVVNGLDSLGIHYEYVQRVLDITEMMFKANRTKWKIVVTKAFGFTNSLDQGAEVYESQKNLIDTMYRLEPEYAKQLIKLSDNENRDNKINSLLQQHIDSLELASKIKNNKALEQKEKDNYRMVVYAVVQAEKALNAERISHKKLPEVSAYLPIGNKLPLHEVFPIFMYYLNNCARTYKAKNLEGAVSTLHRDNFKEAVRATNMIEIISRQKRRNDGGFKQFFVDEAFASNTAVRPGTREEALLFIKSWMDEQLDQLIIIADPYLNKEDLLILKTIIETRKPVEIDFLGSEKGQLDSIEQEFKGHWKKISDEVAPFANISFCWIPENNNVSPFHDRWIITKNSGLRLGTSISSLGISKESEISIMKPNEALKIKENTLLEYINKRKRESNNQRIAYKSFTL